MAAGRLLESLSFKRVLQRGYAIVKDEAGQVISSVQQVESGHSGSVELKDGAVPVIFSSDAAAPPQKPKKAASKKSPPPTQGSLL